MITLQFETINCDVLRKYSIKRSLTSLNITITLDTFDGSKHIKQLRLVFKKNMEIRYKYLEMEHINIAAFTYKTFLDLRCIK